MISYKLTLCLTYVVCVYLTIFAKIPVNGYLNNKTLLTTACVFIVFLITRNRNVCFKLKPALWKPSEGLEPLEHLQLQEIGALPKMDTAELGFAVVFALKA